MYRYLLLVTLWGLLKTGISTNNPPVISVPTSYITVGENENSQFLLDTLDVTDADNDTVTCVMQSTNPVTSDFGLFTNSTHYGLYLLAGSTLNFTLSPCYWLTIQCTDGTAPTTRMIVVNVTPNSPPTFDNLPAQSSTLRANSVQRGDNVLLVAASDVDSTSLAFSMTSRPEFPTLFEIDAVSGRVTAAQDLIYAVDRAYDLTISVTDSLATTTRSLVVPIANNNMNKPPIINNLPMTLHVKETTNGNTNLYTLSISDPDSGDTSTVTFVVNPAIYTSEFTMNGDNLHLLNKLNYEDVQFVTLTFTVSDGKASTNNTDYVLDIVMVDVNDKCLFEYNSYYVTMQEEAAGNYTVDPGFRVTDEDAGSSFTYELQTATSYFRIDANSGLISFAVEYDVDTTHDNSTQFVVYCRDNLGSTDSTTLYVTVEDINDNAPVFDDTGYIFYFDQTVTSLPYNVATLSATDADSGNNAAIVYTWTTTGSGSTYFTLLPAGTIILQSYPQYTLTYGDTFRFVVTASDIGTPSLNGTTTVDLIYTEKVGSTTVATTTVSSATTTSGYPPESDDNSFTDKPGNIALVVVGPLVGVALLGVGVIGLLQYRGKYGLFKPNQQKVMPKPTAEPPKFNFWNEGEFKTMSSGDSTKASPETKTNKTAVVASLNL